MQPRQRGLRYENIRSARAEEGIIRLCLMDPELIRSMSNLSGGQFSSPLLGKVYECLKRRFAQGLSTRLSALAAELEPEEMDHLAHVASQPESAANSRQAMHDYITLIQSEFLRRQEGDPDEWLRQAQQRYKEKKAYMEEKNEH